MYFPRTKTTRLFILALVSTGGAIAVLGFATYVIHRVGDELIASERIFAAERANEQEYQALATELAETATDRATIDSYILHGDAQTVAFLSAIDDLASAARVTLSTTKLEVHTLKDKPYDELDINFDIEGTDQAVLHMLTLLETLPYHSYLTTVDFSRQPASVDRAARTHSTVVFAITYENAE